MVTDEFSVEVKTTGDYAYVEETIKKYYKTLSDNVKTINMYLNEQFSNLLSPNSLGLDRPNYKISHATVTSTKEKVNKALNKIESL